MNEFTLSIDFPLRPLTVQATILGQRNLANDVEDAQRRFIARHRFAQLTSKYYINDAGPFKVFFDDMQPSNMLVDPATLRVTAVLDFEFIYTILAPFAYDPPWWPLCC
jgi:aminoglycoside phosphotransferase (APT) family kinase protein